MALACQVVNGDGVFGQQDVEQFFGASQMEDVGRDYQVVAIMGPQSSGKSTLLNHVFGTNFAEMNAMTGRQQTTKGIWMAVSPKIDHPRTVVLDLEGNDGRERGEDDTSFERQTALFALAVADVVLINMWAKDIGRESGAGKPLLKTIFQVNLKLFTPAPNKRRTVLLFVFRDRTKTPLDKMIEVWEADLGRMWDAIARPKQYTESSFTDFFEVKYAALSNFEEREEDFRAEAVMLRRRFSSDEADDTLVRVSNDKLPSSTVELNMSKIWEVVRANKDLNLPAHRVMVANIRCDEIVHDQLEALRAAAGWGALVEGVEGGVVAGFGGVLGGLLGGCLAAYDEEARYFDDGVSQSKREHLQEQLTTLALPLWQQQVAHVQLDGQAFFDEALRGMLEGGDGQDGRDGGDGGKVGYAEAAARCKARAIAHFTTALQDSIPPLLTWPVDTAVTDFTTNLDTMITATTDAHVTDTLTASTTTMINSLAIPTLSLLDAPPDDLWPRLHTLYARSVANAAQRVQDALKGYDVPVERVGELQETLTQAAQSKLETYVREAANTALSRLRDRFTDRFARDEHGVPRSWGPRVAIPQLASTARGAAGRLLAQLAVIRVAGEAYDAVDGFVGGLVTASGAHASSMPSSSSEDTTELLGLAEWPHVPPHHVLITPPACRTLWRQFVSDSNLVVQQAVATQDANRAASNRMPPVWALAAIVVLGWNEFVALVYNPLWLMVFAFVFFFGRTVYQELDVDTEMQRGLLPGLIALSAKLVPTIQRVAQNTVHSIQQFVQEAAGEQQGYAHKKVEGSSMESSNSTHSNGSVEMTTQENAGGLRNRGGGGGGGHHNAGGY